LYTRTTTAVIGLFTATVLLTACGPTAGDSKASAAATATVPATASAPATTAAVPTKSVPKLVGMGLQSAQDAAQEAGFFGLTSHDSAGRGRMQILDRGWKVCSQTPAAGANVSTGTQIDMGAVKLEESCPGGGDQAPPAKAGATMPNFVGKAVSVARDSLDSGASITTTDATGGRMVLLESNWKVCTQSPGAGASLNGQPVEFTVVKFEESCP